MYDLKIFEFLSDKIFDIPFRYSCNFQSHVHKIFDEFLEKITVIDDEFEPIVKDSIENIKKSCEEIEEIVSLSFLGKMSKAFDKFSVIIDRLAYLMAPSELDSSTREFTFDMELLFRARDNPGKHLSTIDMFHRPFQDRYNIPTYRFSLPGMPCLYLANSTYTCWEELNRPNWSQMYISYFKPKRQLKILNLEYQINTITPYLISHYSPHVSNSSNEKVEATKAIKLCLHRFLNLFPLYIVCYTKVHDACAVFKPEYIFPQFVMQWIINNQDFDGVKYNSIKSMGTKSDFNFGQSFYNYAFPVKTSENEGHCKILLERFELSDPITWDLLNISNPNWHSKVKDYPLFPIRELSLINNEKEQYSNTAFGRIESSILHKMSLKEIFAR